MSVFNRPSLKKQQPEQSNPPLCWHAWLTSATTELHLLLHSSAEPYLFHVFVKRTLLIIGQVTPGSAPPWHDNPIRWEDPGRRYGRNGVEISLPWSETHFLMHNKAFILLAVTRKSLWERERGRVGVKSTENPVFSFCHWVVWWKEGESESGCN